MSGTASRREKQTNEARMTETEERILVALRRIARVLDMNSRRLAARKGVTSIQLLCLNMLANGQADTATEIAGLVHLSPSTVVGVLDRLEAKQLIERRRDTKDRRVVRISLTRKGRNLSSRTQHPVRDMLERSRNGLSRGDAERIAGALEQLVEILGADDIDGVTPYGELPPALPRGPGK